MRALDGNAVGRRNLHPRLTVGVPASLRGDVSWVGRWPSAGLRGCCRRYCRQVVQPR